MRKIDKLFLSLSAKGLLKWIPDKIYLKMRYKIASNGERLNLNNPETFNHKLQWLKIHDRNPIHTINKAGGFSPSALLFI